MAKDFWNSFVRDKSGQSLMEIIIGLSIGAVLIGTASFGIAFILRSGTTNQNLNSASQFTQGLLSNVQSFGNANWQNVYGLTKGTSAQYFLNASGSVFFAAQGQEGIVDNDVTNGLVGEWKFDETTSTTAYDSTGNNNNGTLTNSPTRATSTCKISNCLSFSTTTSDYVNITDPANGSLDFATSSFSVSAWVYTPIVDSSSNVYFIANKWNYSTSINGWGLATRYGTYTFQFGNDGAVCRVSWYGQTTALVTASKWEFVTVTVNRSGNFIIYVDGVNKYQADISSSSSCDMSNGYNFNISTRQGSSAFAGKIDDVRVYNRALSASEVTRLYNSQVFSRYFYVENVCRTNDSSSNISTTTSPCPGGTLDDPLTQKITAVTQWLLGAGADQVNLARYLTRWSNFAVRQTDWSGGTGQEGPVTAPNNLYSSSTNVAVTSTLGSFQIQNLSQQ